MTEFEQGFLVGNRMEKRVLPMILALRAGWQGTSQECGIRFGMTTGSASTLLRALYDLRCIHICGWNDRFSMYGWGDLPDAKKPLSAKTRKSMKESIESAVTAEIQRKQEVIVRVDEMLAECTPTQIKEAENVRLTKHGKETKDGNVRIHRME